MSLHIRMFPVTLADQASSAPHCATVVALLLISHYIIVHVMLFILYLVLIYPWLHSAFHSCLLLASLCQPVPVYVIM